MSEKSPFSFDLRIEQRNLIFFRLLLFIFGLLLVADLYAIYAMPQFSLRLVSDFAYVFPVLLNPAFFIPLMYQSLILLKKQHIYLQNQRQEDLLAVLKSKQKILFLGILMLGAKFLLMCFYTEIFISI